MPQIPAMPTPQFRINPEIITFPYVTDPCQICSFMVWHPTGCANPESVTVTVDKVTVDGTMKHKRPEWRLEASLMGLKQDFSDLDPCGSYEDLQGAMCQFNRWHTIFENLEGRARI